MKTQRFLTVAISAAMMLSVASFSSCKDKDDGPNEQTTDDIISQIPKVDGNKALSVDEQKSYLDQVGKAFMTEFQSSNFDNLIDLINYASDTYGDDYNWDNVDEWADDAYDALVKNAKGTTLVDQYSYTYTDYVRDEQTGEYVEKKVPYSHYYYEDITEVIYTASKYTGHFVAENGGWTYSSAKDLQFQFNDQNGKKCVISLNTSGKTVDAYFDDSYNDYVWEHKQNPDGGETYKSTDYIEKQIVSVPEHITLTLTQDGKELIKSEINTDLSIASSSEYDITKDTYATTTTTVIDGYTFEVSKASLSNKAKNAEAHFKLLKGNVRLLEYSIKANGEVAKDEDDDIELKSLSTEFFIDILGKVQIKGTSKDGNKLIDILDEAEENEDNGSVFKQKIAEANELVDYGMYFDGGSAKQAQVIMEAFEEENWRGNTYWDYDLSIQFADDSKNAFEDFFIKANFRNVTDLYDEMKEDYENKVKVD